MEFGQLKIKHLFYQHGQAHQEKITVFNKIMSDTQLCAKYAFINRHIPCAEHLQIHSVIQAFIKNYQEDRVYCSLNIGISGIVVDEMSI
jgi:hypothetical protein